jgi:hypothetical protein
MVVSKQSNKDISYIEQLPLHHSAYLVAPFIRYGDLPYFPNACCVHASVCGIAQNKVSTKTLRRNHLHLYMEPGLGEICSRPAITADRPRILKTHFCRLLVSLAL